MIEKLSIIIPVYNEINLLQIFIKQLRSKSKSRNELIFVDGGSDDGTKEFLLNCNNVVVISSKKNRSIQMNEGASIANNDWLYFLHIDSILPYNFDSVLTRNLDDNKVVKCFRLKFDNNNFFLYLASVGTKFNVSWCRGGDQSILINKSFYSEIGRFNEKYFIAEDLILFRKIYKYGKVIVLPEHIITSSRKFLQNGIIKTQFHHVLIRIMIFLGFSPNRLNSFAMRIKKK